MRSSMFYVGVILVIIGVALSFTGCAKSPMSVVRVDNNEFQLDQLFTHDGCTLYRFTDWGRSHYYADCRGRTTSTRTENCGKSCNRTIVDEIETAE